MHKNVVDNKKIHIAYRIALVHCASLSSNNIINKGDC